MSTAPSARSGKKRRLGQYVQNIKDSYTISRRTYPWIGWALLGTLVVLLVLAVVLALTTHQATWYWIFMAVLLAAVVDMAILS